MGTVRAVVGIALALLAAGCGRPAAVPTPVASPSSMPGTDAVDVEEESRGPLPVVPAPGSDPDFPAKRPARPGDWLTCFDEPGQTLAQYAWGCTNHRAPDRHTIVIQPFGQVAAKHPKVLDQVRAYTRAFFGVDVRVAGAAPTPEDAWDARRGQCDGDRVLLHLEDQLPGGALAFVGLCEEDLWSGDLNFVFGVASLQRRTGVYSLGRYGGDGEAEFLRRTLRTLSHETGHILCMQHCVRWECLMNGSNSLEEADRVPLFLCPECQAKLRWNTRFDPRARYGALAAFYEEAGLKEEAAFARRQEAKVPAAPAAR